MFRIINKIFYKILFKYLLKNNFEKIIRSIIESKEKIENKVRKIIQIRKADLQYYDFPDNYPIQFRRCQPFFDRYVYELKDVIVSVKKGVVSTYDGYLLQESYGSLRKLFIWDEAFTEKYAKRPNRYFDEELYFIPFKGFYHYLLEELPALLHVLNLYPNIKIGVYSKKYSSYYRDSLKILFQDNFDKIVLFNTDFKASKLFFTQRENYSGFVHIDDINILNKYFEELVKNVNLQINEKIYISRRKANKRKIYNEMEIETYLENLGFSIVYLEELSFKEQIEIIGNASYIISPHGAGLSHLCWRNTKKKVIEIFTSYGYNDCFARLSVMQGYEYKYVRCVERNKKEILNINNLKIFL